MTSLRSARVTWTPTGEQLLPSTIGPVTDEIARLRADREARVALAARALTGSLAGLGESLDQIADDAEHESIDIEALRRLADRTYEAALTALRQEIGQGTFLREEACVTGNRSSAPTR